VHQLVIKGFNIRYLI